MAYISAEVRELGWSVANRLRGLATPEDFYPLVYLVRFARKGGTAVGALREVAELASEGDRDVAVLLEQAVDHMPAGATLEDLADRLAAFDADALDSYLMHGPSPLGVFGGEHTTPEGIAKLALAILDIQPGDKVVDFGCGQGTFLEAAAAECPSARLAGVEINPGTLAVAKMRSKVSGSDVAYSREDMFRFYESSVACDPVDKAFSNYPWGMRTTGLPKVSEYIEGVLKGQGRYGRPTSADWVFNRVLVDSLGDGGTAVAIMSDGACFNGTDRPVREHFVRNGLIKAVVALPKDVFAPYTMIQTSLVVLCTGGAQGVRFVDATDLGTKDRRNSSINGPAIAEIMSRLANDSDRSATKSLEEIAARDFSLSAKRYLEKEIKVPDGVELSSIATIRRGASLRAAELDALTCEEDTGISYLNLSNMSDGGIDNLPNLSVLDPKLEKYCICDGDVLVSRSGAPFKVAVAEVPEGRRVIASSNLYVVSVDRERIDPYYLAAFLASPAGKETLARGAVGTTVPNLPIAALSAAIVPLEGAERQKTVADAYLAKIDEIKVLKLRLSRARREVSDLFDEEA